MYETILRCAKRLVRDTELSAEAISGMTLISVYEIEALIEEIRN